MGQDFQGGQLVDSKGHVIPNAFRYSTFQAVSYDSSTASSAFGADTKLLRLVSTTNCHIAFGATPTATTSTQYLPANIPIIMKCTPTQKVAAIKASGGTAGILSVGEIVD